ncbi:MAG: hypoxanthine phosphoribosyltransferase [Bacilli bacterium]|nr:hypoxanthine phosphoribosyltransferase [Bacilli bacterium]
MSFEKDINEVLFTNEQLTEKIREVGQKISKDYEGQELLVVGILAGSIIFMSHLLENLDVECKIDFIKCKSYDGENSTGSITIQKDLSMDPRGKNILLVEDIVDTGLTVSFMVQSLLARGAKSVKVASLLDKPARREYKVDVDYSCFECPDKFIVGFGLDYNQYYRNLPYIGVLNAAAIKAHK